jgi:nucleotide-binding universal stress UspA family protein
VREYRTFVVAYDFSEHARAALDTAADLARRLGADLHLVYVLHLPAYAHSFAPAGGAMTPLPLDVVQLREDALRSLHEVVAKVENLPERVEFHLVEGTAIANSICDVAETVEADLIVMGTHGRTGLAHVFLGSVAERTLRNAHCPVLTVRGSEKGVEG